MLYYIAPLLIQIYPGFNVIHYVSFRTIGALLTSLGLSIILGDRFIEYSRRLLSAKTREHVPENHQKKGIMPTMGGLFMILMIVISAFMWVHFLQAEIMILMGSLIFFGSLGALDDWSKISKKRGISERLKFTIQLFFAFLLVSLWVYHCHASTELFIPFFKHAHPDLVWFFVVWAIFILVGASNGVNLTDGLDGLATGTLIVNFATFSLIAYLVGHAVIADYLVLPFAGTSELTVFGGAIVGSLMGFLWFNAYPAQIFMGDVGSLSLGATLGFFALMTKQELLLALSGGLFVVETLSVILQVFSYKVRKKRLFRMAPIHHHFELLGWPESKITIRFTILSFVLCLLALLTLKIR